LHILIKYEWKVLEICEPVLRAPHAFQHVLSKEETPCLTYTIPSFHAVINKWEDLQVKHLKLAEIIQEGINKLTDYLDKVKDVPVYFLSMIINPDMKMRWINRKIPECKREILQTLYDKLQTQHSMTSALQQSRNAPQPARSTLDQDDDWVTDMLGLGEEKSHGTGNVESEVAEYLKDTSVVPEGKNRLLKYWEANQTRYSTLFALAVNLLPVQGTSVSCKWLFSSSHHTKTDLQATLGNKLMEALQILKNNIKKNRPLNLMKHMNWTLELAEQVDMMLNMEDHVLETINANEFAASLSPCSFVH
ncbi:hATC-domain-containing protein, partial [Moniliophthora roreri MCA 2997]